MALACAWTVVAEGRLSAAEQAKLWGLREALKMIGEDSGQWQLMADRVSVGGGGHPSREAVRQFFTRVDATEGWYLGRATGAGRPKELTPAKRKVIADSMMAAKRRKQEPGYEAALARCPVTTHNAKTGQPFSRTTINDVLTTECYDYIPDKPWQFRFGPSKRPVTKSAQQERFLWGKRLLSEGNTGAWFLRHIIWIDICSKIIPGTPTKAFDQVQKGRNLKKRLMSADAAYDSQHLGGSSTAEKQCSSGDTRVWFFVAMARGVFGVHAFSDIDTFPGENQIGAGMCIDRLPGMLDKMLGKDSSKPRTLFSDRGPGFYHRRWGVITSEYDAACQRHGFKPWAGAQAKIGPHAQPPDIADVLLHETAISTLRLRIAKSNATLREPWSETPLEFKARMGELVKAMNETCDFAKLCKGFPERLQALVERQGDRLPK